MIINRPFWQQKIESAWKQKNIIWLMGVRRIGKTSLCQSVPETTYFDCERPRVRQLFGDPEAFLESQHNKRIILDEIHRLDNPSEILKLAADHYPSVKIIATGSSTLGASAKFKDTLTGRKKELWLTPLLLEELTLFDNIDLRHRLLFGGFPAYFTQTEVPEQDFREWIDAYWAKDIQELFTVGKRHSFQKCAELLLANSGGIFEASKFTAPCEASRPTIANYVAILENTFVIHVVRPYSTRKVNEIIMAPKIYGLDTGFVCYAKEWHTLRQEDLGVLWEHCVLNEIHGHLQTRAIHYWRDKSGHELDFVLPDKSGRNITTIECKFSALRATNDNALLAGIAKNVAAFRRHYPTGKNLVVASDVDTPFTRSYENITLSFVNAQKLTEYF